MALKLKHATPETANTDTDLLATVAAGYAFIALSLIIHAVTATGINIKIYGETGTLAQTIPLSLGAGETVFLDTKIVIPAGGKLAVSSTVTDTTFSLHGDLSEV